jgi:hypothetical protein
VRQIEPIKLHSLDKQSAVTSTRFKIHPPINILAGNPRRQRYVKLPDIRYRVGLRKIVVQKIIGFRHSQPFRDPILNQNATRTLQNSFCCIDTNTSQLAPNKYSYSRNASFCCVKLSRKRCTRPPMPHRSTHRLVLVALYSCVATPITRHASFDPASIDPLIVNELLEVLINLSSLRPASSKQVVS